jgi:hypothetical protein
MQPRKLGFYSQESGNIVSSTVGKGPGEFASSIPFGNPSKTKNSHKESQKRTGVLAGFSDYPRQAASNFG